MLEEKLFFKIKKENDLSLMASLRTTVFVRTVRKTIVIKLFNQTISTCRSCIFLMSKFCYTFFYRCLCAYRAHDNFYLTILSELCFPDCMFIALLTFIKIQINIDNYISCKNISCKKCTAETISFMFCLCKF